MRVNPANASELANVAREVGAEVIEGNVSYPSETGGWLVGNLDFCEHPDTYSGRKVMVIIADWAGGRYLTGGVHLRDSRLRDERGWTVPAVQDSE